MLTVIATFRAKPGREKEVERELLALVGPSRAEVGCINYDLHVCEDDPCLFVFHENWTGKAALDRHAQEPHIVRWREHERKSGVLAEPGRIELFTRIEP